MGPIMAARHRLSLTDPLTGAGNRRAFDEQLERELARAGRSARRVGLLLIDVDHFKQINDVHGHDVGDRVLGEVCRCLSERLRAEDRLAPVGGDEFAAIITNLGSDRELEQLAGALCAAAREAGRSAGEGLAVSVSIGGASASSRDPARLRLAADRALYSAKAQGRDVAVVQQAAPAHPLPTRPAAGSPRRLRG
jgi:diguanylate cyclase (GGDEF)-like protein